MRYSTALSGYLHARASSHLLRADGQEDLCFAIWYPSQGNSRLTMVVQDLVLPEPRDRRVHGNVSFEAQYFERALGAAVDSGGGLAFLHSHPDGHGWQGMSSDDVKAEMRLAGSVAGATGLPILGMTIAGDQAWSARVWTRSGPRKYERRWCESVRVVGKEMAVTSANRPTPVRSARLARTISGWGLVIQESLQELHVGVIGAGSVGSLVAEALARMGIRRITLMDFDTIEEINLDRVLHSTDADVRAKRAKVVALARGLRQTATAKKIIATPLEWSVVEEEGFRAALDCDVLFSCVDRPWPRQALNLIAYAHLIPVIDGGVRLEPRRDGHGLKRGDVRAHTASPGRACFECLRIFDPADVGLERSGQLDDAAYVAGLPPTHRLRVRQNVFTFSMLAAALETLQFLSLIVSPGGLSDPGAQTYHFVPGSLDSGFLECEVGCPYAAVIGRGDRSGITVTGRHLSAELARSSRASHT